MQKKVCRHCGRLLPATSFPRRGGRVCRSCYPEVYPRPSWRDTCAARKARQAQNARGAAPLAIAVDFDGVICQEKFPAIGPLHLATIVALKQVQANGHKLILHTCREGALLDDALKLSAAFGLTFDAVNTNLPERTAYYGRDTRKIGADLYLDDRTPGYSTDLILSCLWDIIARGPCDQTWPGAESTEVEAEGGEA